MVLPWFLEHAHAGNVMFVIKCHVFFFFYHGIAMVCVVAFILLTKTIKNIFIT